jgi:serine/threonine-protein kinase
MQERLAAVAVSRFGLDRGLVDGTVQAVRHAHELGKDVELLDALVSSRLLSVSQADELRREFGQTPEETARQADSDPPIRTSSGYYLRTLGEYRLLRRLGQGGMGSVYLAYEENQKAQVAIKVLADELANNPGYVERFYREAKSGALLNHPNIVRCIKAGRDAATGKHYLVLEYIDGPSAHGLLEKYGRLEIGDAIRIILDIARALEHAHSRNIIHRDIKPDNILITPSGVAKLADLGLAKRLDDSSQLTSLRQGFGSLYYIPMEQAYEAKQADGRSDIYALGATLYHLITGEVPFPGKNHLEIAEKKLEGRFAPASELNGDVTPVLDAIIAKALAREPADRYQLVSQMIVDLERSGLAAQVPSFVDPDLARRDPLVRANIAAAQPTQLDLSQRLDAAKNGRHPEEWYLRYRSGEGRWCKAKMTADEIRQRLRSGRIPVGAQAGRDPQGEFRELSSYSEFRPERSTRADPVQTESELPRTSRWPYLIGAGLVLLALAGGAALLILFSR